MRCTYCEWKCELGEETFGVCRMYHAKDGVIKERFPHKWSSCSVSRIESLPFYHAWPGSRSLTIGTFGCNFMCKYCSNGFIARQDPEEWTERMYDMTPDEMIRMAQKLGCHNIVFNVNEPTVSMPTLQELHKCAQKADIPMGCFTNAYTTVEATEEMAEIFSFVNVGLKSFSSEFYREYIGIPNIDPVLRNMKILAKACHLEVITPVIQDVNSGELSTIADFLADIDPEIPWHVFRLLPEHDMKDTCYPGIEEINDSLHYARTRLKYVYFHNFIGSDWVNTICPSCGMDVIERFSLGCSGDRLKAFHCKDNRCPSCGEEIRILGKKLIWNVREVA